MRKAFSNNNKTITAQAGKKRKMANIAIAFEEGYGVRCVGERIRDIVENMISPSFLAVRSRATYIRYTSVGMTIVKNQTVRPILGKLERDARAVETLNITWFDNPSLYFFSENNSLLMIQAAAIFDKIK